MSAVDIAKLPKLPARDLLGGRVLEVDDGTGRARVRYVPGAQLQNPNKTILGGYLAAMIDDAAGLATWFGGGKRNFTTVQMSVNFLRGAKPDEALIVDVTITGSGARQAFVEARVLRERDTKLVATATLVQTFIDQAAAS